TFSNSKSREDIFDVQRDHRILLILAKGCLAEGGTIIFSTNFRKFQLDESLKENFDIKDMTKESIPFDFERNSRIHRCFFLSARLLNM
ncbi:MAG: 23S rRNA (guanine(2445)-N(2))/(guanine(2069)-N(7))-methyltransferase, partial [Spirochaetia bacterium]|nr:23S rRNA (guanine(2445)-N(2))/(guanine(2069)-N(7))-methyltransferase [Spirochaetia bacterium]